MWFKYMQFHQKMLKLQRTRDSQIFAEIYCETYSSVFLLAIAILRDAYRADKVVDQFYHLLLTTIQTMQNTAPLHLWIYAQVIRLAMEEDQQGEQIQQQAFHKGAVVQEKKWVIKGN